MQLIESLRKTEIEDEGGGGERRKEERRKGM